jgi:hypothetical protein
LFVDHFGLREDDGAARLDDELVDNMVSPAEAVHVDECVGVVGDDDAVGDGDDVGVFAVVGLDGDVPGPKFERDAR